MKNLTKITEVLLAQIHSRIDVLPKRNTLQVLEQEQFLEGENKRIKLH